MPPSDPYGDSGLDARLREIDRRLREVRKAIRKAEKGLTARVPETVTASAPAAAPTLRRPSTAAQARRPSQSPPDAELFQLPSDPRTAEPVGGGSSRSGPPAGRPGWGQIEDKKRFANYFSGSMLSPRAAQESRRVQRSRAILMLIVVAVLAYIVYYLARR